MYTKENKIKIIREYHRKLEAFGSKNKYHKEIIAHILVCIVIADNNKGKKLFQVKAFVDAYYELTALLSKNYKIIYKLIKCPISYDDKEYLKFLRELIGKLGSLTLVSNDVIHNNLFGYRKIPGYLEIPEQYNLAKPRKEYRDIFSLKYPNYFPSPEHKTVNFLQKPILIDTKRIIRLDKVPKNLDEYFKETNFKTIYQNGNLVVLTITKNNLLQCVIYSTKKEKITKLYRQKIDFNSTITRCCDLFFNDKNLLLQCEFCWKRYDRTAVFLWDFSKNTISEIEEIPWGLFYEHWGHKTTVLALNKKGDIFFHNSHQTDDIRSERNKLKIIKKTKPTKLVTINLPEIEHAYYRQTPPLGVYDESKERLIFCRNHRVWSGFKNEFLICDCKNNKIINTWIYEGERTVGIKYVPSNRLISIHAKKEFKVTYILWDLARGEKIKTITIDLNPEVLNSFFKAYDIRFAGSHIICINDWDEYKEYYLHDFDLNLITKNAKLPRFCQNYMYIILQNGYVIVVREEDKSIIVDKYKFPRK